MENIDTEHSAIVFYAFRYALDRRSYVAVDVANYIIKHWDELHNREKISLKNEIISAIINHKAGRQIDVENWKRILHLPVLTSI